MRLTYKFNDGNKDVEFEYTITRDEIIEFLEDRYEERQLRRLLQLVTKHGGTPKYLINSDLHDIYERMDAEEIIAHYLPIIDDEELHKDLADFFRDDAEHEFNYQLEDKVDINESYDNYSLLEEFDDEEDEEVEEKDTEVKVSDDEPDFEYDETEVDVPEEHKEFYDEYVEKYGNTVTYGNDQVECVILDVDYNDEQGYNIKIENPMYVAELDDTFKEIWIGDPNKEVEEVVQPEDLFNPESDSELDIDTTDEDETDTYSEEDNPDYIETDDFLNDNL